MPRRPPAVLRAYVAAVCLLGFSCLAVVLAGSQLAWNSADPWVFGTLAVLIVVGELRPIVVPRGDTHDEITISTTFALALALVGPLALAVAVQAAAVATKELRSGKPPGKVAYSVAQSALTLCAARAVFALLTGAPLLHGTPLQLPDQLPAALGAGIVFFVVHHTLAAAFNAMAVGVPVMRTLITDLRFLVTTSGVLLSLAPVVAAAAHVSVWLVPLLLLPIAAIQKSAKLATDREREALHDALTGLPNRTLFRLRLQRALENAERHGSRFGVMLVDLDHFKEINETLGHRFGDDLIVEVGRRLSQNLRPGDTVARLGGDEFAVLTVDLPSGEDGVRVAERLLETLEDPFVADNVRLGVEASIGVALHPVHGDGVDVLLAHADIALYDAKSHRGSIRLYEPTTDDHTPERLALAAELRHGLQTDELFLVFQAKIAAASGRVVGFEALVRWQHPTRGLLLPDEFLPVVENTGLMGPLTMTVLDKALSAVGAWHAAGHEVSVAVNLSVRHLTDLDLPRKVQAMLAERGLPPSALILEVTETVLMSDPARASAVLCLLRDLGVGVAIDDFGTGYSSLAYLRRLEIDELKIDKSFVSDLPRDDGDAAIVRSTIELGHNLGLRVVAEGVEDDESLHMLRAWGCDVVQGYGISRPLAAAEVTRWLDARAAHVTGLSSRRSPAVLAAVEDRALLALPLQAGEATG